MKKIAMYLANRFWLIMLLYLISIVISAFLFAYFEQRTFSDGTWWSFVTALTIGYGDLSPVTLEGRMVGVLFGHFWIFFIIPMIIANIVVKLLEDKNKFTHEEQEWQENCFKAIADKVGAQLPPSPKDY